MIYGLVRRLMFALDAESAHELAVGGIERLQQIPSALRVIAHVCRPPAVARRELLGMAFPSPVGIAAGFDKNAVMVPFLAALGFGFIEVGTVTPLPQAGNPRPRLFRYPASKALINRMGFNNDGAEAVATRLRAVRSGTAVAIPPLFVNVGKNRDVPLDRAAEDYARCYEMLAPYADAVVLNLSSPNTPSLRELQRPEHLAAIIDAVRSRGPRRPLLVKIAPDLDDAQLDEICDLCLRAVDGLICTNTTVDRMAGMDEAGGLSGAPLMEKSTRILGAARRRVGPSYPLIGVGGVFTADDVSAKFTAGADLVQVYTGFIYEGPGLARTLARGVRASMPASRRASLPGQ